MLPDRRCLCAIWLFGLRRSRSRFVCSAAAFATSATPVANAGTPVTFPIRIADLSPDGKSMAAYDASSKLCVYDLATQKERACADLKAKKIALRPDDIVWSPDSTKIAFAERAFEYLKDGDLWVMDAATGQLTDLTDDGYQGTFFRSARIRTRSRAKPFTRMCCRRGRPTARKSPFRAVQSSTASRPGMNLRSFRRPAAMSRC